MFKTQYKSHRNQEKERSEACPMRNTIPESATNSIFSFSASISAFYYHIPFFLLYKTKQCAMHYWQKKTTNHYCRLPKPSSFLSLQHNADEKRHTCYIAEDGDFLGWKNPKPDDFELNGKS